ncbi:hypothetical protein KHQ06_16070 [Nocardia tengchongensis]|uniref:Uncharacterized protein n=1 Tax=Nocardia tengchongensis TaxID=2055889 RepID=A0ABX8CW73_9NOCA|nr:hypothetical protein [Nocardia tengchongensis]QVI24153.1 hypothetical protein KHQ06_16070 [Nocardia tengchongensis]
MLWAFAVIAGGVALLLVVLTLTHVGTTANPADTTEVTSTAVPAPPAVPPSPCFPFQTTC